MINRSKEAIYKEKVDPNQNEPPWWRVSLWPLDPQMTHFSRWHHNYRIVNGRCVYTCFETKTVSNVYHRVMEMLWTDACGAFELLITFTLSPQLSGERRRRDERFSLNYISPSRRRSRSVGITICNSDGTKHCEYLSRAASSITHSWLYTKFNV